MEPEPGKPANLRRQPVKGNVCEKRAAQWNCAVTVRAVRRRNARANQQRLRKRCLPTGSRTSVALNAQNAQNGSGVEGSLMNVKPTRWELLQNAVKVLTNQAARNPEMNAALPAHLTWNRRKCEPQKRSDASPWHPQQNRFKVQF